jgi:HAD superfamily hydrolase (TIGR01484 family)
MQDFSTWSAQSDPHYASRDVVAFDLDDTLTWQGALPSFIVEKLERAQHDGILTVLVTGRSAGWVDAIIKLLPFDAVVGENGALLSFWPARKAGRKAREEPRKLYWLRDELYGSAAPVDIRERFEEARQKILSAFPRARVASDQGFRVYDLAIDFAEEVDPPLSLEDAEGIRELFERMGAVAKVSSIHVNGWWGSFTKELGLRELLGKHYGKSLEENLIYTGDSPNDGPLFAVAGMSVGVANIRHFQGLSKFHWPRFVTREESARGCAEILDALRKKQGAGLG